MQDYARKSDKLQRMKDNGVGMTKSEFRSHQADKQYVKANQDVGTINDRIKELKAKQLEHRQKDGSGSRQDRAFDRELESLNNVLGKATKFAEKAGVTAVKAQAYALGLGKDYKAYEKAANRFDAKGARFDAARKLAAHEEKIIKARKSGADKKELAKLNRVKKDLVKDLTKADKLFGKLSRRSKGLNTKSSRRNAVREINRANNFAKNFQQARALDSLTDRELSDRVTILNAADKRIGQSLKGPVGNS